MQHKILITTVRDFHRDPGCGTSIHTIIAEFSSKTAADAAIAAVNDSPKNDVNYYQTAIALY